MGNRDIDFVLLFYNYGFGMLEFLCVNIWGPIWLRNLKNTLQKAPNFMQKYAKEKITSVSCCKRTCNNGFWTIFMLHFKKKKNIFWFTFKHFFLAKYLQYFYYQNDIEYFWGNWGCCITSSIFYLAWIFYPYFEYFTCLRPETPIQHSAFKWKVLVLHEQGF